MSYRFAFYVSAKPRTLKFAEMLARGAKVHGDSVAPAALSKTLLDEYPSVDNFVVDDYDGVAVLGINRQTIRFMELCRQKGKRFLFFDKGYMDRYNYWRVSIDAWQPLDYFQDIAQPDDRLSKLADGRHLRYEIPPPFLPNYSPLRRERSHVLVAGTSQKHNDLHGLGNVCLYYDNIVQRISQHTSLPIIYRPKPSWAARNAWTVPRGAQVQVSLPHGFFSEELERARVVVTHGSSAGFVALSRGVPVIELGDGIVEPMSVSVITKEALENPYFPSMEEYQQFFCDVAYCQWTKEEYQSGEAWSHIATVLDNLEIQRNEQGCP